ncbi:MAG: transcription elongation GreA/GreB family factor [Bacteriovoracaceae bacterium]|jgi:transcription elongation GreA/GreB family factor
MLKEKILNQLKNNVETELKKVKQAYETTKNLVQNGDLKSDGKYDTRATEANYLADGMRQRITDLEQELELLGEVNLNIKHKVVSIGSLVEINLNGNNRNYFIAPTAGGTMVNIDGEVVLVISVFSPIGDGVLGLEANESFEIELKGEMREYEVVSHQ